MPIRETTEQDFAAITAMTNEVIANTTIHFGYEPLADDELPALWRAQRAQFPWLTLVEDEIILGYAKAGSWRSRAAYQWTCETSIFLVASAQGKGLGTQLYSALLDACRARGFHSVIGGITLPNPGSVSLHEKLGFASVGVVQHAGKKFGEWHDVGFWQKLLTASST